MPNSARGVNDGVSKTMPVTTFLHVDYSRIIGLW